MRLESFRVQNYKKIRDTGWVSCRDLMAFVGKNESGKSAIFRGLSKLNPSDGEKYDGLKEFPRRRYTDEFALQDWPVSTGLFVLTDEERGQLVQMSPLLKGIKKVAVTRLYSWNTTVEFNPTPKIEPVSSNEFRDAIDVAVGQIQESTAPEGKGDALGAIKQALVSQLQQVRQQFGGANSAIGKQHADQVVNMIAGQANEEWRKEILNPIVAPFRDMATRLNSIDKLTAAKSWVIEHLPRFIYFDNYDVIDSAVYIPTFAQQATGNQGGPRVRTTYCLFKHVGLDVNKIAQLGRHQPSQGENGNVRRQVDERAILASSASNSMTQKFEDWWEQRHHVFRYQIDGDYFRIWVSDDLDPSEIELDQRSVGMQYFFSFFLVFLVEAGEAHANSILLLDEPGLHLHGTAQMKLIEFLRKLSADNQTFYSTHSPFMVDCDHLENARAVFEDTDGTTKVSEDVWPRDKDSLFPLQAALGYQLAQGLFISKRQLIVEGLTDLWLIKAFDQALATLNKPHLRPDVVVVPAAGVTKLLPLASMLAGHDVEIAALLDGDEPARKEGKKLVEKLLAGEDHKCLFIGDFVGIKSAEIEDVFPEDEYLSAVRDAYPNVKLAFTAADNALVGVVNKIQSLFEREKLGPFEKWRPSAILRDRILSAPEKVASTTVDTMTKIFEAVNDLFSSPS